MTQSPSWPPLRPIQDLPIWQTVKDAYRNVFVDNLHHLPNAAFVPLLLSLAIDLLGTYVSVQTTYHGTMSARPYISIIVGIVWWIVSLVPYVMFAINWHRLILLGEHLAAPPAIPRWQERHSIFFRKALALLIFLLIPAFIILVAIGTILVLYLIAPSNHELFSQVVGLVFGLAISWIALRVAFVFPVEAIDMPSRFGLAWDQTKGQGLRLVIANALAMLPIFVVSMLLRFAIGPENFDLTPGIDPKIAQDTALSANLIDVIVNGTFGYVFLAVGVSVLSIAFRTCTGWPPPDAVEKLASS